MPYRQIIISLTILFSTVLSFGQNKIDDEDIILEETNNYPPDSIIVEGIVRAYGGPKAFIDVVQKGTTNQTQTDFDGTFKMTIHPKYEHERIMLQIKYRGLSKEVLITENSINMDIDLNPPPITCAMPEGCPTIIIYQPKRDDCLISGYTFSREQLLRGL